MIIYREQRALHLQRVQRTHKAVCDAAHGGGRCARSPCTLHPAPPPPYDFTVAAGSPATCCAPCTLHPPPSTLRPPPCTLLARAGWRAPQGSRASPPASLTSPTAAPQQSHRPHSRVIAECHSRVSVAEWLIAQGQRQALLARAIRRRYTEPGGGGGKRGGSGEGGGWLRGAHAEPPAPPLRTHNTPSCRLSRAPCAIHACAVLVSRAGAEPDLAALELQPPLPGLTLTWGYP